MSKELNQVKVAMLVCDGFEEVEMTKPRAALKKMGATVDLITPQGKTVKGWNHDHWTKKYKIDVPLSKARATNYDALILPGGVMNPDHLRTSKTAIKFIKQFFSQHKLIAAICHGLWTLIETGKLKNKKLTSYHSIKTDLKNAKARWVNQKVVIDDQLITSRNPNDIPAFNKAIIQYLTKESALS